MPNPWTKKNPLMSLWLSAANAAVGSARGRATAAARRNASTAVSTATSEWLRLMTGAPVRRPATRRKKRR